MDRTIGFTVFQVRGQLGDDLFPQFRRKLWYGQTVAYFFLPITHG